MSVCKAIAVKNSSVLFPWFFEISISLSKPSFDSIEAIAAQETDEDFQAQNAQKYIAIVHADGDNIGSVIENISDEKLLNILKSNELT